MSGCSLILRISFIAILLQPAIGRAADSTGDPKSRNKLALKAASRGEFKEAVKIWEGLLHEVPDATALGISANLAVAYRELGDLPQSWHHLTWYLKNSKKKDVTAGEELQLLEKDLTGAGFIRVAVACGPPDSLVYFGKLEQGKAYACPLAWWVKPGKMWVTLASKGYQTRSVELDVRKRGEQTAHNIRLTKVAPTHGELVVDGKGRAIQVFLNGALEGTVPFRRKLVPGDYELMVGKPGKMPWKKKVTIVAGKTQIERPPVAQPVPEIVKSEPKPTTVPGEIVSKPGKVERGSRAWKWALFGSGVAIVAGGGVMSVLAGNAYKNAEDKYLVPYYALSTDQQNAEYYGMRAKFDDEVTTNVQPKLVSSYVMYGIGGAAAASGAALLLWDMLSDKPSSVSLVPTIGGNHAGFALSLDF